MKRKSIVLMLVALVVSVFVGAVSAQDRTRRFDFDMIRELTGIVTDATGLTALEIRQAVNDGSTLAEVITANGGNVDEVITQAVESLTVRINEALENGHINEGQATGLIESLEERVTNWVNNTPQGRANGVRGNRHSRQIVRLVAEATGLDTTDVVTQVQEGSSLATILTDNGVDVTGFIAEQSATLQERLAEQVESGRMSQEVADARLALFEAQMNDWLNRTIETE